MNNLPYSWNGRELNPQLRNRKSNHYTTIRHTLKALKVYFIFNTKIAKIKINRVHVITCMVGSIDMEK